MAAVPTTRSTGQQCHAERIGSMTLFLAVLHHKQVHVVRRAKCFAMDGPGVAEHPRYVEGMGEAWWPLIRQPLAPRASSQLRRRGRVSPLRVKRTSSQRARKSATMSSGPQAMDGEWPCWLLMPQSALRRNFRKLGLRFSAKALAPSACSVDQKLGRTKSRREESP